MSWTFDAPSMTYRNHALSSNIRRQAIADAKFMQFVRAEPGYGKKQGESVTITRILRLPLATRVTETDRLPSGRPAIETKQVSISQWGFKIPVTELERDLTHFDLMNPFQASLRDQMMLTMDQMAAQAFTITPYKYVPTVAGGTFSTNGTPAALATSNLRVQDLRRIYDELHGTLKAPTYKGGRYVGILSTQAARGIKNDPDYKDWQAPTTSAPLNDGKLRNIEGFDLYETNNFEAIANFAGTSTVGGSAVFFGADSVGLVQIRAPEIRAGMPEELGTFQEVGWVGTLEAFLVWESAALSRAIHVSST